jgi:Tfp pilus assembly protein PilZ
MARRLQLRFADARALREVYQRDLFLGGAFVATRDVFELREIVELEIALASTGGSLVEEGEVVHCRGPEDPGGPGVAVQLLGDPVELRGRVERLLEAEEGEAAVPSAEVRASPDPGEGAPDGSWLEVRVDGEVGPPPAAGGFGPEDAAASGFDPSLRELALGTGEAAGAVGPASDRHGSEEADPLVDVSDRRDASRAPARVRARLSSGSVCLEGLSRDLSQAGVLVSADASALAEGSSVHVALREAASGATVEAEGTVARHLHVEGTPVAVAIRFDAAAAASEPLAAFVRRVKQTEVERILSGISGAIEELGMPNLLEMLSRSSAAGTLTVARGAEQGVVAFERGVLRYVRLAGLRGEKALARLVSWEQGTFSFHAQVEPLEEEDPPVSVEAALLDALRRLDEARRAHWAPPAPTTTFRLDSRTLTEPSGTSKAEQAVLELAAAGFTLRRILDVIPESDADILAALRALEERGVLARVEALGSGSPSPPRSGTG